MKTGLSKRERILIIGLAVVLVAYLAVQFGVRPLLDRYDIVQKEFFRLSDERDAYERNIASETLILDGNKKAREDYEELKKKFPALMPNEEIDHILTGLCIKYGLRPIMLYISDPAPLQTEKGESSDGADDGSLAVFMKVTATMNVNSSFSALEDLVTAVEKIEYIRIIFENYSAKAASGGNRDVPNISVKFELTLLNNLPGYDIAK